MFRKKAAPEKPKSTVGVEELRRALYNAERGNLHQARIHLKRAMLELKEAEGGK